MTETTRPTSVRVIADHTPGPHRTDSDDLWLVAADHRPHRQRPGVPASPATPPTARPAGRPTIWPAWSAWPATGPGCG